MEYIKLAFLFIIIISLEYITGHYLKLPKIYKALIDILLILIYIKFAVSIMKNKTPFVPSKEIYATPEDFQLDYEDININLGKGIIIKAWLIHRKNNDKEGPYILFCHGNAGNISHRLPIAKTLSEKGFNVMLFDYRGYGESTGKPSEKGIYEDTLAVYNYMVNNKKIHPSKINLIGISLGCNAALYLAQREKINTITIIAPITSAKEVARTIPLYYIFSFFLESNFLNNKIFVEKIKIPILIAHSKDDEIVPYDMGKKLFEICPSKNKKFITLSGGHNEDYFEDDKFTDTIKEFIEK